jgi:hypothetical protein
MPRSYFFRLQLHQFGARTIAERIDRAVRSDPHIPDAKFQVRQQRLFRHHLVAIQFKPIQHHAAQPADKDAVFPGREQIALVESQTGRRENSARYCSNYHDGKNAPIAAKRHIFCIATKSAFLLMK